MTHSHSHLCVPVGSVSCLKYLSFTFTKQGNLLEESICIFLQSLWPLDCILGSGPEGLHHVQAITERAAAVIGNLSGTEQFFSAIRECGGLQRLVALLDSGPESKVTEIAAKSLANMADNENNRKGIELAGGRPALIHLLTQRPSREVAHVSKGQLKQNCGRPSLRHLTSATSCWTGKFQGSTSFSVCRVIANGCGVFQRLQAHLCEAVKEAGAWAGDPGGRGSLEAHEGHGCREEDHSRDPALLPGPAAAEGVCRGFAAWESTSG